MTFQTPLHLQRLRLRNDRHLIDAAMTGRTADAFVDVNRVIEIGEVRQIMHAYPFKRLSVFETFTHRLEIRTIGPNLLVAIHAHRGRGNTGGRRCLDRRVAITAIDTVIAHVMFVAELNWLLALDVGAGVPTRPRDFRRYPQRGQQNKDRAKNGSSREIVRAVSENLWHRRRYNLLTLTGGLIHRCCTQAGAESTNATSKNSRVIAEGVTLAACEDFFKRRSN